MWSEVETTALLELIAELGTNDWKVVANRLAQLKLGENRSNKDCWGRWRSITRSANEALRMRGEDALHRHATRRRAGVHPVGAASVVGSPSSAPVQTDSQLPPPVPEPSIIRAVASPGASPIPKVKKHRPPSRKWDATKFEALTEGIRAHGSKWQLVARTSVNVKTDDGIEQTITPLLQMYDKKQTCLKDKFKSIMTTLETIDDGRETSVDPDLVSKYRRVADAMEKHRDGEKANIMSQAEIQAHVHDVLTGDHHPHQQQPQPDVPQAVGHPRRVPRRVPRRPRRRQRPRGWNVGRAIACFIACSAGDVAFWISLAHDSYFWHPWWRGSNDADRTRYAGVRRCRDPRVRNPVAGPDGSARGYRERAFRYIAPSKHDPVDIYGCFELSGGDGGAICGVPRSPGVCPRRPVTSPSGRDPGPGP